MQRYFARVVRALIVSTLGFGGGVGLMVFIVTLVIRGDQHAFQYGVRAGVLIGLVFAILLVCVLLPLDLTFHLFLAKGLHTEIWELEQAREVAFQGALRDAMAMVRKALLAVPYVKSVSDDPEARTVVASIGKSWRSGSGEIMEVTITPTGDNNWQLRCTSRSASTVVFDYGKNFENVETWLKQMSALMAAESKAA